MRYLAFRISQSETDDKISCVSYALTASQALGYNYQIHINRLTLNMKYSIINSSYKKKHVVIKYSKLNKKLN